MGSIHVFFVVCEQSEQAKWVWNKCGLFDKIRSGRIKIVSIKKNKAKRTWKMPVRDNAPVTQLHTDVPGEIRVGFDQLSGKG